MNRLYKLFGGLQMKWLTVILFALGAGIYTGLVMVPSFLKDTSFQDIGILYEWWVIFAVIVVTNCKKNWEAMLKCFVFFLISQPLVYGVEILFGTVTLTQAAGYYLHMWGPMTLLILPGGLVAYYCKKQNALGAVVMGLGNTIVLIMAAFYVIQTATNFPRHLFSALVSLGGAAAMTVGVQKQNKNRIIATVVAVGMTALIIGFIKWRGLYLVSNVF